MSDYIEREATKKRAIAIPLGGKFVEVVPVGEIESLPAADVAPVRHGMWVEQHSDFDLCGIVYYECSECKREQQVKWHYCPNCGAKMDEVASNGNYE